LVISDFSNQKAVKIGREAERTFRSGITLPKSNFSREDIFSLFLIPDKDFCSKLLINLVENKKEDQKTLFFPFFQSLEHF